MERVTEDSTSWVKSGQPVTKQAVEELASINRGFRAEREITHEPRRVYFENLIDPNEGAASVMGNAEVSPEVLELCAQIAMRQYLVSKGNCILAEAVKKQTLQYAHYLAEQGLLAWKAIKNTVWVPDPSNIHNVIQQAAQQDLAVVPYAHRSRIHEIANDNDVIIDGNSKEIADQTVERFNNKIVYRDWIQERYGNAGIPYPRVSLSSASSLEDTIKELQKLLFYGDTVQGERKPGSPALFAQLAVSGGGVGNFVIRTAENNKFTISNSFMSGKPRELSICELANHLFEVSQSTREPLDVTPFVTLASSYTLAMTITDTGVTVVGPLDQIIDSKSNDYRGWKVDVDTQAADYPRLDNQINIAVEYGKMLHSIGFRGWADEDLFVFADHSGELHTSRSESNLRRDGMSQLLGVILDDNRLAKKFIQGKLSVIQDDHLSVAPGSDVENVWRFAQKLAAQKIPLASKDNPLGVYLMGVPIPDANGGYQVAVAVVAENDKQRNEWLSMLKDVCKPVITGESS